MVMWASSATDSIWTSCSSLLSTNRRFGQAKKRLLTAASVSELCLGLENAQHNVSATSCVLLCMQNSSTVSVQHMCAPMQHPSAVYWQEKGWDLDFGCFMVLSPSHLHSVCYRGCAFTGKIQI